MEHDEAGGWSGAGRHTASISAGILLLAGACLLTGPVAVGCAILSATLLTLAAHVALNPQRDDTAMAQVGFPEQDHLSPNSEAAPSSSMRIDVAPPEERWALRMASAQTSERAR